VVAMFLVWFLPCFCLLGMSKRQCTLDVKKFVIVPVRFVPIYLASARDMIREDDSAQF